MKPPKLLAEFINPGSIGKGSTPSHSTSNSLAVRDRLSINTAIVVEGIGTANPSLGGIQENGFWPMKEKAKEKKKTPNIF